MLAPFFPGFGVTMLRFDDAWRKSFDSQFRRLVRVLCPGVYEALVFSHLMSLRFDTRPVFKVSDDEHSHTVLHLWSARGDKTIAGVYLPIPFWLVDYILGGSTPGRLCRRHRSSDRSLRWTWSMLHCLAIAVGAEPRDWRGLEPWMRDVDS
jgi:hypothetical protein